MSEGARHISIQHKGSESNLLLLASPNTAPNTTQQHKVPLIKTIGWLSFSIIFNVLNTIVYGALVPELLSDVTTNHEAVFANMSFITTLVSAISLPFIGSILDQLEIVKACLIVCQFLGIIVTFGFVFMDKIPQGLQVTMIQLFYIVGMFFLRTSVMNNNALLACFPAENRVRLSLVSNFIGFSVNFAGLLTLTFLVSKGLPLTIWVGIILLVAVAASPFTLFHPTLPPVVEDGLVKKKGVIEVTKLSVLRIVDTLKRVPHDREYRCAMLFLLAYLFYCAAGAAFTIFLSTFYLKAYSLSLTEETSLNLYFKISMLVGTLIGYLYERFTQGKVSDYITLIFHNILYIGGNVSLYIVVMLNFGRTWAYMSAFLIGGVYAWNMSLSRGMMSRLIPQGKTSEFMALYSTFTYVGIAVVSLVYKEVVQGGYSPNTLPLILAVFVAPSFIFLALVRYEKQRGDYSLLKNEQ
eukprot:TRINITY_DN3389_c0_g1_i6.p1 TRINITY_DN3389_c0_g1~~TRINITY_DN3389_c0_g1_i6.p1  ORF type:complete len:466 (+),score=54.39 TRINITY_DN3389_c0_g1_i6:182-1579(+)